MKNSKQKKTLKILLALDGSKHSKTTIEEIANRLFPGNTQVRIVSAYEKGSLVTPMGPLGAAKEVYTMGNRYALKAAETITGNAAKILREKNPSLTITTTVIEGSPKSAILKEAERFGADLIVVGSHGSGPVGRFLLGSVSQAVALHAKCSVEIVRK